MGLTMEGEDREIINLLALPPEQLQGVRDKLIYLLNKLINEDFEKLVQLLYRVDIDEQRLKMVLHQNSGKDAATLIAGLLLERQMEKIRHRHATPKDEKTGETAW